jgi:hypothetical protein
MEDANLELTGTEEAREGSQEETRDEIAEMVLDSLADEPGEDANEPGTREEPEEEDTEEPGEDANKPGTQEPKEDKKEDAGETYTLRYGGAEYTLGKDAVLDLAGKGMDYDGLRADRDALRDEFAAIDAIAKQYGMSRGEYIKSVDMGMRTRALMDAGHDEEAAREIAARDWELDRLREGKEAREKAEEETAGRSRSVNGELEAFAARFPDVDVDKPDKELHGAISEGLKNGLTLTESYQKYLIDKKESELAKLRTAEKNKTNTPGPVRTKKADAPMSIAGIVLGGLMED